MRPKILITATLLTLASSPAPVKAVADEAGDPISVPAETISALLDIAWWDWPLKKIEANLAFLESGDLAALRKA